MCIRCVLTFFYCFLFPLCFVFVFVLSSSLKSVNSSSTPSRSTFERRNHRSSAHSQKQNRKNSMRQPEEQNNNTHTRTHTTHTQTRPKDQPQPHLATHSIAPCDSHPLFVHMNFFRALSPPHDHLPLATRARPAIASDARHRKPMRIDIHRFSIVRCWKRAHT